MGSADERDLDVEVDRLYQAPLDQFIQARTELARRLGRAGGPTVRALPKPSVLGWALNQLYWRKRQTFDRLVAAAARLRAAQADALLGKPAAMRTVGEDHRGAIREALRETAAILEAASHPLTPDTIRELTGALEALPWQERPGRLARPPVASGFGALAGLPVAEREPATPEPRATSKPSAAGKGADLPKTAAPQDQTPLEEPRTHPKPGARPRDTQRRPGVGQSSSFARQAALKTARAAVAAARRAEAEAAAMLRRAGARAEAARDQERAARAALESAERQRSASEAERAAAAAALDAARRATVAAVGQLAQTERTSSS